MPDNKLTRESFSKMAPDKTWMPRVLAISYFFPPESSSGAIRNIKLLTSLSEISCELFVLTVHERYFGQDRSGQKSEPARLGGVSRPIQVFRTRCLFPERLLSQSKQFLLWPFRTMSSGGSNQLEQFAGARSRDPSAFQNVKDHISDFFCTPDIQSGWLPFAVWTGIQVCKRHRIDLIYAVGKPWTAFFIGYALRFIFKKPLIIDFMDPWSQNFMQKGRTRFFGKVDTLLERFIVQRSDHIIANTPELAQDFLQRFGLRESCVHVVTCGYDPDDFVNTENAEESISEKFTISHIGQFYSDRSPLNFLKAVRHLVEEKMIPLDALAVRFVGNMQGAEPEVEKLIDLLVQDGILTVRSWIPHDEAIRHMMASQLLLVVQINAPLQVPAKLYEYLATGKPILALCEPGSATANLVRRFSCGKPVSYDEVRAIAGAILDSYEEYCKRIGKSEGPSSNIDRYNINNIAKTMEQIFHDALSS